MEILVVVFITVDCEAGDRERKKCHRGKKARNLESKDNRSAQLCDM